MVYWKIFQRCTGWDSPFNNSLWYMMIQESERSIIHRGIIRLLCLAGSTQCLPCKAKKQYLLTLQVSRYCRLALQSSHNVSLAVLIMWCMRATSALQMVPRPHVFNQWSCVNKFGQQYGQCQRAVLWQLKYRTGTFGGGCMETLPWFGRWNTSVLQIRTEAMPRWTPNILMRPCKFGFVLFHWRPMDASVGPWQEISPCPLVYVYRQSTRD